MHARTHHDNITELLRPHRRKAIELLDRGLMPTQMKDVRVMYAAVEEAMRRGAPESDPYDIETIFSTPPIVRTFAHIEATLSVADANSFLTEIFNRYACHKAGDKQYEVAPGLFEHLFNTEVRNVKCDMLKLPYPCIYIVVPKSAGLTIPKQISEAIAKDEGLESLGEVRVEGMYISEVIWSGGPRVVHGVTQADTGEELHVQAERAIDLHKPGSRVRRSWMFSVIAEGATRTGDGLPDKTVYTFEQPLPIETPIGEAMEARKSWLMKYGASYRAAGDNHWDKYFDFAMNLILYLTYEPNVEIEEVWCNKEAEALKRKIQHMKEGVKKGRAKARLKEMNPERRLYVGRHHANLADALHVPGTTKEGHPLTVRVLVTGHWRNQPVGTGRVERKLIWIAPFWRGPKGAPISNPRRIVT